jgi:hypothetical protein
MCHTPCDNQIRKLLDSAPVQPESHGTLFDEVAALEWAGELETCVDRVWNGRFGERWVYRWASDLLLRLDAGEFRVSGLELTITHEKTGERMFYNTWATNHAISTATVPALAQAGRTRWKIENDSNNTFKNQGYHLEYNFGHGQQGLSLVLCTLKLPAFLLHTIQALHRAALSPTPASRGFPPNLFPSLARPHAILRLCLVGRPLAPHVREPSHPFPHTPTSGRMRIAAKKNKFAETAA